MRPEVWNEFFGKIQNPHHRLRVTDQERKLLKEKNVKIVAQIWGNTPENYRQVIKEITKRWSQRRPINEKEESESRCETAMEGCFLFDRNL